MTQDTYDREEFMEDHPELGTSYDVDVLIDGMLDWLDAEAGDSAPPAVPQGYVVDHKGRMVPETLIRPQDVLEDQTVKLIAGFAFALANQVQRFKQHSAADIAALDALVAEEYTPRRVATRGNASYSTIDGRLRVVVQSQDKISFGPQIQAVKTIIEGLIERWGAGASDEARALIAHAWPTDRPGQIHRESMLRLLRLDIDDPEWRAVQRAIRDSVRVTGSKRYLRVQYRATPDNRWRNMPIDLAAEWES